MAKKKATFAQDRMPPEDFQKIRTQVHTIVSTSGQGMPLMQLLKDVKDMFGYDFEELAQRHGYNAVQLLELMVEDVIVGIKGKQYWIQGIVKHTTQHVQDLIQRTKPKSKTKKRSLVRFVGRSGRFTKSAVAPTHYPHFAGRCLAPPTFTDGRSRSHFYTPTTGNVMFPSPMLQSSGIRATKDFWTLSSSTSALNKQAMLTSSFPTPNTQATKTLSYSGSSRQPMKTFSYSASSRQSTMTSSYSASSRQSTMTSSYSAPSRQPTMTSSYSVSNKQATLTSSCSAPSRQPTLTLNKQGNQTSTVFPPRKRFTKEKVQTDSQVVQPLSQLSGSVSSVKLEIKSEPAFEVDSSILTSNVVLQPVKQEVLSPNKNEMWIQARLNYNIKTVRNNLPSFAQSFVEKPQLLDPGTETPSNIETKLSSETQNNGHDDIENIVNLFGGTAYLPVVECEYYLMKNQPLTLTELQKIYKTNSLIVKDIFDAHFELSVKYRYIVLSTGKHSASRCHDDYNSLFAHIISQPDQCCTLDAALLAKHNIRPNPSAFIDRVKKSPLSKLFKILIEPGKLVIRGNVPPFMLQNN